MSDTNSGKGAGSRLSSRNIMGAACLLLALLIWIPSGDVVEMIIRGKDIVFGKYSWGHFSGLLVLSTLLLGMAALCFSSLKSIGEMVGVSLMVLLSTALSVFVLVVGSGWAAKPRYVEKVVHQQSAGMEIAGLVRHRPPREYYELEQVDKPEQLRSYPGTPAGYPAFRLTLTTDQNGFRNREVDGKLQEHYPIVAVGDSFVAGSHVSDNQAWVSLLSERWQTPIYNLGVSGSDPGTYYNNFILLGQQFKPRQVFFMIYEGNDFKKITPLVSTVPAAASPASSPGVAANDSAWAEQISRLAQGSPVTQGLRRLLTEVFAAAGSTRPVPEYADKVGFMPLTYRGENFIHHYAFEPKRLIYLWEDTDRFQQSDSWQRVADIMQRLTERGQQAGFELVFLYAPSTPHVIMPLMQEQIPAEQLRNFAAYEEEQLPDAATFKTQVFQRMDRQQQVFLDHCAARHYRCLALTEALQAAARAGQQVYYSYDQHWTPDGNRVVAEAIAQALGPAAPHY